jgi:hypothetical protein
MAIRISAETVIATWAVRCRCGISLSGRTCSGRRISRLRGRRNQGYRHKFSEAVVPSCVHIAWRWICFSVVLLYPLALRRTIGISFRTFRGTTGVVCSLFKQTQDLEVFDSDRPCLYLLTRYDMNQVTCVGPLTHTSQNLEISCSSAYVKSSLAPSLYSNALHQCIDWICKFVNFSFLRHRAKLSVSVLNRMCETLHAPFVTEQHKYNPAFFEICNTVQVRSVSENAIANWVTHRGAAQQKL